MTFCYRIFLRLFGRVHTTAVDRITK